MNESTLGRHVVAFALLACLASAALAQTSAVIKACKSDADKLCAGIQPGGGRIAECLIKNQAAVSAPCQSQLSTIKQCAQEAKTICGDASQGTLAACLQTNRDKFSAACKA